MKYSEILHNPHFNNIAHMVRVPFGSAAWKRQHPKFAFWSRLDDLDKVKTEEFFAKNRQEFTNRFLLFLSDLTTEDPALTYTTEDMDWLIAALDGEHALTIISLLFAWFSALDRMLTPVEAAEATGQAESTWRNRAAAGELSGAVKKGKQWLIPESIVRRAI